MLSSKHITILTYDSPAGPVHALKDINLTIGRGEIYGIIGLSGAGKSTLIRCINMLERPTSGTVTVDGQDLTAMSDSELRKVRKSIGMIFQHFNLLSSATVYDNIAFPLRLVGTDESTIKAKVEELLGRNCSASSASLTRRTSIRRSSRAGRSSASALPARLRATRRSCSATRQRVPSTRRRRRPSFR